MFIPHNTASDPSDASCAAALASLNFLRGHGAGLCDLIDILSDETAFEALCDLHGQSGAALPDARLVRRALRTIRSALATQRTRKVDALSARRGYCVDTSVRWYGARVSDLLAAFR